jgi:hypothetical protein
MIRPTTPTSAGFAQAFDSSQVWHRDIPEFTNKVNEYYGYISENYDALKNKTRNLDKYYKMRGMENELMNFSVASKAMGQNVDKAQKLMLDKPELYDTPENRALIDGIITGSAYGEGGLAQGYKERTALNNSFMKDFGRNIFIDTPEIKERMMEYAQPDIEDVQTATIEGRRKASQYRYKYDVEGMAAELQEMWKNGYTSVRGDVSSNDLQRKYEGNFERFATAMTDGLPEFTDPKEFTEAAPPSESGRKPSQFDITVKPTTRRISGSYDTESHVGGVKIAGKTIGGKTQYGTVNYNYPTYSQGGVSVSGTQTMYKWNAGAGGFDMDGAVWSQTKLAEDGRMALTGVDYGAIAQYPITFKNIKLADENGELQDVKEYTVQKGQPLSEEMVKAVQAGQANIVDGDGKVVSLNTYNANNYIYTGKTAFSQSIPNVTGIDLSDPTSFFSALDSPGVRQIAMPWDDFKAQSTIPQDDIEGIEAGLRTYEYEPPFAEPPKVTGGSLDEQMRQAAEEAARAAAGGK